LKRRFRREKESGTGEKRSSMWRRESRVIVEWRRESVE